MPLANSSFVPIALGATLLAGTARGQINDYGDLDWTFNGPPGSSGYVADEVLYVSGPNGGCSQGDTATFTTVAPQSGVLRYSLYWSNLDDWGGFEPVFDWPLTYVDGDATPLFDDSHWYSGAHHLELSVQAGQVFGFGVGASDCLAGPGVAYFTDLEWHPEAWQDLGQGLDPSLDLAIPGSDVQPQFAQAVVPLGDLDGDGVPDLAGAAPIAAYSGVDGSVIWSEADATLEGIELVNAGDVDGDGVPDLAVAHEPSATVRMLSGGSGTQLWSWAAPAGEPYGSALVAFGDMDSDGVLDLAVGAVATDSLPVRILSGALGTELLALQPGSGDHDFGAALGAPGDLDQDQVGDLVVSSRQFGPMHVYSGATGAYLLGLDSLGYEGIPYCIEGAGDWNGDGVRDVALGAVPFWNQYSYLPGTVEIYSGADGTLLTELEGSFPYSRFGSSIAGDLDLEGDGWPELAIAAGGWGFEDHPVPGRVVVVSAPDGAIVREYLGEEALVVHDVVPVDHPTGLRLAFAVDSSVEGRAIRLYSDFDHQGTPRLEMYGPVGPNAPQGASIEGAVPNGVVILVLGLSQVDLPLLGGVLVPHLDVLKSYGTDAEGRFDLLAEWPSFAPSGLTLWAQAWMLDPDAPFGFAATNATRTP